MVCVGGDILVVTGFNYDIGSDCYVVVTLYTTVTYR